MLQSLSCAAEVIAIHPKMFLPSIGLADQPLRSTLRRMSRDGPCRLDGISYARVINQAVQRHKCLTVRLRFNPAVAAMQVDQSGSVSSIAGSWFPVRCPLVWWTGTL